MRGKAEAQAVELVEAWGDSREKAAALGVQKEAERAGEREAKGGGDAAGKSIIEDDGGIRGFESEGEDTGFSGTKIAGERKCGRTAWMADFDPRELGGIGKVKTREPAFGEFFHDSVRNDDAPGERGQNLQPSKLMKVLEG